MAGIAVNPLWLHLARAAQGAGGAMMFGTSLALIAQEFQGRERGTALGLWGATTAAALSIGPLVGGALTEVLSWRWIFLVNVPIGIAAIAIARLRLAESRNERSRGLDLPGVATLCPALFLLVFSLIRGNDEGWGSPVIVASLAGAIIGLALFVSIEVRAPAPLLDLRLFRKPAFTGATLVAFCLSASILSMFLYITLFFQDVLGYSPLQAGLRQLPVTGLLLVVSPLSGRLSARIAPRLLMGTGLALVSLGLLLMHGIDASSGWTALLPGQICAGIGIGLTTPALASTAVAVAPPTQNGMASGANNTARQLGIATGIAALGSIFEHKILLGLKALLAGTPAAVRVGQLAHAVAAGGTEPVLAKVPAAARPVLTRASHHAFISAFNEIVIIALAVAAAGAIAGYALIRTRDLVASSRAQSRPSSRDTAAPGSVAANVRA
jgi:EmrB/QacA subfamily drug resistance transporter